MSVLQVGLPTVTATITAIVGAFVAYQGYRGYRRNDSRPMLFLAVGIALLTTITFLVRISLKLSGIVSDASVYVLALLVSIAGLLAVLYSFTIS